MLLYTGFLMPMIDLNEPLCVICHDAGASNQIVGLLRDQGIKQFKLSAQGPASDIFKKHFPLINSLPMELALEGVKTLLSGTSVSSVLEHEARKLAKNKGIKSLAVVDHWVNYPERFERNDEFVLADEILVSDEV